jgi:hypothetical protein
LKEDIQNASSALEEFEDIVVKDYVVKASGKNMTGVIAQEINETHPEMVHEEGGKLLVELPSVWKLLKAIQELKEMFDALVGGNYSVGSKAVFDEDMIGTATVLVNSTFVEVEFGEEYGVVPIVTLTPREFVNGAYKVSDETINGFRIVLQKGQDKEIGFNWHAFAQVSGDKVSSVAVNLNKSVVSVPEIVDESNETLNETEDLNVSIPVPPIRDDPAGPNETVNETIDLNVTLPDINESDNKNAQVNEIIPEINASVPEKNDSVEELVENFSEEEVNFSFPITGGVIGTNNQDNVFTKIFNFGLLMPYMNWFY